MSQYESLTLFFNIVVAVSAVVIGVFQILINLRLKKLQDYVAIAAVPGEGVIKLLNTGTINLYLHGFKILDNDQKFERPRLLPAGAGETAYYWIPPPVTLKVGEEFKLTIYLKDEFDKKWISEHGGERLNLQADYDNKERNLLALRIWSYKTYKAKWQF